MVVLDFVTRAMIIIVGMLFPGYKSFKAIKKTDVAEQQRMLKYWLVLSILSAIMLLLEPLLSPRVPMYNVLKIAFIAFLVNPKTAGFEKIYDMAVQPLLDQHETKIDDQLNYIVKATDERARNIVPTVIEYVQQGKEMATRTMSKKTT